MSDADAWRRMRQAERRKAKSGPGPCLLCGKYQNVLNPGRDAGFHVYCDLCAIGTRTPASLEE